MTLMARVMSRSILGFVLGCCMAATNAGTPSDTIDRVKGSIVAIGTFQKTRNPGFQFRGTGFVVGDGTLVATNAHVLPESLDAANRETLVVVTMVSGEAQPRAATKVAVDEDHDVAVVKISGRPLQPLKLGDAGKVREGENYFFTGYPIGAALGLFPATHKAMIAAIIPISIPLPSAQNLDAKVVRRLRAGSFPAIQLDGTAYPGNSGSPLYHPETGDVVGVINMVFVKGTKEAAITAPSGISYAIPIHYLQQLMGARSVK
ncbi:MAG: serine protease [Burkholderiales bacterium]